MCHEAQVYGLPPERIWVSVFETDDETFALWRDVVGVPVERIRRMGAADNFWEAGATGAARAHFDDRQSGTFQQEVEQRLGTHLTLK